MPVGPDAGRILDPARQDFSGATDPTIGSEPRRPFTRHGRGLAGWRRWSARRWRSTWGQGCPADIVAAQALAGDDRSLGSLGLASVVDARASIFPSYIKNAAEDGREAAKEREAGKDREASKDREAIKTRIAAAVTRPPRVTSEADWDDDDETAAAKAAGYQTLLSRALPALSSVSASSAKPASEARVNLASVGAASGAGLGRGGGAGSGSGGRTGSGSGGEGTGTGGGIGEGSQLYTTVAHPPVAVSRVLPEYPDAARSRDLEGEVVLRAIVDRHGAVERDVVVVESVPMLDRAAIAALRQWRFEPGRDTNNRAVRVVIEVPLRFRLR